MILKHNFMHGCMCTYLQLCEYDLITTRVYLILNIHNGVYVCITKTRVPNISHKHIIYVLI